MEFGFGLGSNKGDRLANIGAARRLIGETAGTRVVAVSSVYETEPIDVLPQYKDLPFLNAVIIAESKLSATDWLKRIAEIEDTLGRVRSEDKNAPRRLDVDILYSGDQCIDGGGLIVPHPRWASRRFVVEPLAEVRPQLLLPGAGQTVEHVFKELADTSEVRILPDAW